MKSALEIAMERFKDVAGEDTISLTAEQRQKIKEVDRLYDSKVAEKKILLEQRIQQANQAHDLVKAKEIQEELTTEISRLQTAREKEKVKTRQG